MTAESERLLAEVEEIFGEHDDRTLLWRPNDAKWSATGHLAHLCIVHDRYVETIESQIDAARARGRPVGDGPYRHPWFGRWFATSMEPPPKRRIRTFRAMIPDPAVGTDDTLERFRAVQARLLGALDRARGLDLGRIRFSSPYAWFARLTLGTALALLVAHNRRHVWLIREVLDQEGARGWEAAARTGEPGPRVGVAEPPDTDSTSFL